MKIGTNAAGFFPEEGDKVTGRYFGVEFSGVVSSARANSMNWGRFQIGVDFDAPITVNDSLRTGGMLMVDSDTMADDFSRTVLTPSQVEG